MVNRIILTERSILLAMEPKTKRTIYSRVLTKGKNKTGYVGVMKRWNDYVAQIRIRGRTHVIGIYATPQAAHKAYMKTCKSLGIKVKFKP